MAEVFKGHYMTEVSVPEDVLVVTDIYLAGYLHAMGFKVKETRSVGFKSEFVFIGVTADIVNGYYNGQQVTISARKLYDSFQTMRKLSRNGRLFPKELD